MKFELVLITMVAPRAAISSISRRPRFCESFQRVSRRVTAISKSRDQWAAFDKDNTSRLLARLPFADFGEMIDPPSADVTAHVVEMLGALGVPHDVNRFLRVDAMCPRGEQQNRDGSNRSRHRATIHVRGVSATA